MPVLFCPRCQRANPESAGFCHFDGTELRSRQDGQASFHRLGQDFVFPSGRRCRTYDDFAQACRDEWPAARDLLRQGMFKQFFGSTGRADLAKAAHDAMVQADPDIALTTFVDALPITQTQLPKIDINPRRLLLGNLLAGEQRQLQLIVSNQGHGTLQGTLTVTEGNDWLKIDAANPAQCAVAAPREQKIGLLVSTRGLPAGGNFSARLTVITNGGVVEVQARMELVAQPYPKPPFQGAKTPREMAERMRKLPKAAVPALENGDVSRWFTGNGWNFPVRGAQARGVAGVQQFFETMGLSKPPVVQLTQTEVRLSCNYPETVRSQIGLQTAAKKWVYAVIASDSPWLRVLTPQVSGPQQATLAFEVDPRQGAGTPLEGALQITANGGRTLTVKVSAEVRGAPRGRRAVPRPAEGARAWEGAGSPARAGSSAAGGVMRPILAMALAFCLVRIVLMPFADLGGSAAAVRTAAAKLGVSPAGDSPLSGLGGWLQLPWTRILSGGDGKLPANLFHPGADGEISIREFRHYFASFFLRGLLLWTWWLGAALGALALLRREGGMANLPWGLLAGAFAGVAASITAGSIFLVIEIVPHALWGLAGQGSGLGSWLAWVAVAIASWAGMGALAGWLLSLVAPLKRHLVVPVQRAVVGLCRLCGLRGLAQACAN